MVFIALLMVLLIATSIFLILLVLIQRGRGGGLAGAFGGMGGQSAFGAKAGDLFTRITIGAASFWIVLCALTVWYMGRSAGDSASTRLGGSGPLAPASAPAESDGAAPATPPSSAPAPGAGESAPATPAAPAGDSSK